MATHDYNIANDTHANVRADFNNVLAAVRTFNSNSGAPSTVFPNMIYADTSTTPNTYRVRNNGDSAWASLFTDTGLIRAANGAVSGPSIGWSSTTTHGLYYGSSTSWSAAVAGVNAFTLSTTLHGWNLAAGDIDFSIGATGGGANSFFVQGSDGFVGMGTNAPAFQLHAINDTISQLCFSTAFGSASGAYINLRKSRGTHASPAALSSGDTIGRVQASAYHSTGTPGFVISGREEFFTDAAESGDTVPTAWRVYTMPSGGSLTERMRITSAGLIGLNAVTSPSYDISFGGNSPRFLGLERHTTANTAGGSLGIVAGGATSGATDKDGGFIGISSGLSTGTGRGYLGLNGYTQAASTGTSDNSSVIRTTIGTQKQLANNSAETLVSATLAAGSAVCGVIEYGIQVWDGTDLQVETGSVAVRATNKAGAFTTAATKYGNTQSMTSGTLTVTFAASSANPTVISVNANSSLTPSTGYPRINYVYHNLSNQAITVA